MLRFNEDNQVIKKEKYNAILVGIQRDEDISYSMEELEGLAKAAGVDVLGHMIQNMEKPNTATLIGKGKVGGACPHDRVHGSGHGNIQ